MAEDIDEPHDDRPERTSAELNALEATELNRLRLQYSRVSSHRPAPSTLTPKPTTLFGRSIYAIKKFWRHQISVKVDHSTCRDHLALERTFLGYLRTSLAFSMIGISVAYLFRIQHAPNPSPVFGFYKLGKPVSYILQGIAISTLLIGAFRTWRSQNAIVRGKAISGGFEIVAIALSTFLTLSAICALMIAVDIRKEDL